jgi:glucuronate isomerase
MVIMAATSELRLHSDRLLPSESGLRSTARQLYESVKDLPIISPHGHVPAHWLADDIAFHDPTSLLITPTTTSTGSCTPMGWSCPRWVWAKAG